MRFVCPLVVVKGIAASVRFYRELFDLEIEYDFGENVSFSGTAVLEFVCADGRCFRGGDLLPPA